MNTGRASDAGSAGLPNQLRNAAREGSVRRRDLLLDPLSVLRGVVELARARWELRRLSSADVAILNQRADQQASRRPAREDEADRLIDRVAVVIANAARIVPWRSDCLVQAMAAQRWLASRGLAGRIEIGLPPAPSGLFEPHAWLVCANCVVTGGDIRNFSVLLGNPDATGTRRG